MTESCIQMGGKFVFQLWEGDKKLVDKTISNGIVLTSINDLWEVYFRGGTQSSTWYIGLIDNTGYTAVNNSTDTMSSHSGWTELHTEYSEATRPEWSTDAAASQTIANSGKAIFTFTSSGDIRGFFITSDNTKNGTTGTLWSTAVLDVVQAVQPGQEGKVFYSLLGQEG